MTGARIINGIVWLYVWLSDVLNPVFSQGDFWAEKAKQLLRPNSNFDDPGRLLGNAVVPFVLWLVIDWRLRKRAKRESTESE
jgi:hypothetical protein